MSYLDPASLDAAAFPIDPCAARALVERHVATLGELAEIGMRIARAAGRRAEASLDGETAGGDDIRDPGLAYARAARAVRMCIALQARLVGELPALERAEGKARYERNNARRKQILSLVERVGETGHGTEIDRIVSEAREHLRDADEYDAVMILPLAEAVACICKDLGVVPDWSLWGAGERSGAEVRSTAPSEAGAAAAAPSAAFPGCDGLHPQPHPSPVEGQGPVVSPKPIARPPPPG